MLKFVKREEVDKVIMIESDEGEIIIIDEELKKKKELEEKKKTAKDKDEEDCKTQ